MTQSSSSPVAQSPTKSSWFTGCIINALIILLAILGIYDLIFGSIIAYVFSSAHILSVINISILFIIACNCVIYFFLVFRIKRQHWLTSAVLLTVVWLVLAVPLSLLINISTARVRVGGYSMGATLRDGSYVLAYKQAYQQNEVQRGDIIVFRYPPDPNQELIKRVIGLPGETIALKDGTVTINDAQLEEPYLTEPALYNGKWMVPEDQFFVLGDNRNESSDSHSWGFLPRENIIGKAVWIYFPLSSFGEIIGINSSR